MATHSLPDNAQYVRTTPVFDNKSIPDGLLSVHHLAANTWGLIAVEAGELAFVFEDQPEQTHTITPGEPFVVPPLLPHHVSIVDGTRFSIEFHSTRPGKA